MAQTKKGQQTDRRGSPRREADRKALMIANRVYRRQVVSDKQAKADRAEASKDRKNLAEHLVDCTAARKEAKESMETGFSLIAKRLDAQDADLQVIRNTRLVLSIGHKLALGFFAVCGGVLTTLQLIDYYLKLQ